MYCKKETLELAISKGFRQCSCSAGGYPNCECDKGNIRFPVRLDNVQRWLREKFFLHLTLNSIYNNDTVEGFTVILFNLVPIFPFSWYHRIYVGDSIFSNYDEGQEFAINKLLHNIK